MSAAPRPVVPLDEVWKKLQQNLLTAKKAIDDFKMANPVITTDLQREKLNTVLYAFDIAQQRADRHQNEIKALYNVHVDYLIPKLVDINAQERFLKIWELRKEDATN
jgi:hypothetical protein